MSEVCAALDPEVALAVKKVTDKKATDELTDRIQQLRGEFRKVGRSPLTRVDKEKRFCHLYTEFAQLWNETKVRKIAARDKFQGKRARACRRLLIRAAAAARREIRVSE